LAEVAVAAFGGAPGQPSREVTLVGEPHLAVGELAQLGRRAVEPCAAVVHDDDVLADRGDVVGLVG
jgi:hypothetical protein